MTKDAAARIDCHIHSQYSPDGVGALHELVARGRAQGLTGIVVTDHNSLRMAKDMRDGKSRGFTLIPGIEVSTADGHCLALGARSEVPRGLPLVETLEAIEDVGGLGVPSHPFRRVHGVGRRVVLGAKAHLRALEVYNARDGNKASNRKTQDLARAHALAGTGGSDAHRILEVGNAYTACPDPVGSADDLIDQIRRGRTWGEGHATPRLFILRQNVKNLWLYARRGFRGI